MDRARTAPTVGIALLVVALLAGGALWWTAGDDPAAPAEPTRAVVRGDDATRAATSSAPDHAPAPAGEVSALRTPAAPVAADDGAEDDGPPLQPLNAAGRVTDARGQPLAGVDVWLVPTGATLVATGTPLEAVRHERRPCHMCRQPRPFLDSVPLAGLPHARTDAEGRFRLATPHLPVFARDAGVAWDVSLEPTTPHLLLASPGWTTRTIDAERPRAGELARGSYMLEPEARVSGRVVDADGQPVGDARVRLVGAQMKPREAVNVRSFDTLFHAELHEARADAQGAFELGGLWCGGANLEFAAPGFLALERYVEFDEPGTLALGDVVLTRGARLAGRVLDADGRPLPDADVVVPAGDLSRARGIGRATPIPDDADGVAAEHAIASRTPAGRARTDADGRFVIDALEGVNFRVYAHAPGHDWARVKDVPPGEDDLVIALPRAATLELRVVDARTGVALPDADVEAGRISGTGHQVPLEVAPHDGGLRVIGVGLRGTRLTVEAPGHARRVLEAPGAADADAEQREPFVVELEPEARVTGRVVSSQGEPLHHAEVTLRDDAEWPYPVLHTTHTDAAGAFRFENLGPLESFLLRAVAADHAPRFTGTLALDAGAALADVELVLPRAASLVGTAFDATGAPELYAELYLDAAPFDDTQRSPALRTTWLFTEEDGGYAFLDLAPGRYRLRPRFLPSVEFELAEGETRVNDLHLPAEPLLRGRVLAAGRPVVGAMVQAKPGRGLHLAPRDPVATDARGEYELRTQAAGNYTLAVVRDDGSGDPDPLPGGVALELAWGEARTVDLTIPAATITVSALELGTNTPRAGISIALDRLGDDGAKWETLTYGESDAEGRCAFEGLLPGTYRVGSDSYAYTWQHIPARSARLELDAEDGVDVTLELDRGAVLTGEVATSGGALARDGAAVKVYREGGSRHGWLGFVEGGRYTVAGLRPGTYRVIAQLEYLSTEERDSGGVMITLAERERRELDLVAE